MSAKPSIPIKVRAEALRLRDTGMSFAQIAAKCTKIAKRNVSEATVRKWCKDAADAPEAPTERDRAPDSAAEPEPPEASSDDPLAVLRELITEHKALAKLARRDGNAAAAAKALGAAAKAADTLARLEAGKRSGLGEGDLVITREQYAAAERTVNERVAKLAADLERTGGMVCGECGRKIRIALASKPQGQNSDGDDK